MPVYGFFPRTKAADEAAAPPMIMQPSPLMQPTQPIASGSQGAAYSAEIAQV